MSITDELREWVTGAKPAVVDGCSISVGTMAYGCKKALLSIADRIDAEHEKAVNAFERDMGMEPMTYENMAKHGWVRLPLDADGAPIHVGDVVTMQLLFGGESKPLVVDRMELSHGRDGDLWCVALDTDKECWNQPSLMRHYTPPTVEDVLREFASDIADVLGGDDFRLEDNDELFAEYAAKLQLKEDE